MLTDCTTLIQPIRQTPQYCRCLQVVIYIHKPQFHEVLLQGFPAAHVVVAPSRVIPWGDGNQ